MLNGEKQIKGMRMRTQGVRGAADAPVVELWAAGDDATSLFAVAGAGGAVLWRGRLDADRTLHPAWRLGSANTIAAIKAVQLAGRTRADAGVPSVRLLLHVPADDISRDALAVAAVKAGVAVDVDLSAADPGWAQLVTGPLADRRHAAMRGAA